MKKMIYGITLIDWDDVEVGIEYFFDKEERDLRMKEVSMSKVEAD